MDQLFMGFSETDITPAGSIEMVGFGRADEISRGVLHPLSAQVTIWKLGDECGCVAAIDHIGFTRQHASELRDQMASILSVSREQVMLCFSHGHSSPNESATPAYYTFVCEQITAATDRALHQMEPVKAVWGNAQTDIGLNRRTSSTASDRRIGILKVVDARTSELKLLLLRLTAHGNVLKADNYLISPDYFGSVRDAFRARHGCPVMVTQGAAGNIAPKYFQSQLTPYDAADDRFIRHEDALGQMAAVVLADAGPLIEKLEPENVDRLHLFSHQIDLIADVPDEPLALQVVADARQYCGLDGANWLAEVRRLRGQNIVCQHDPTEVQYFLLGNGGLGGVANEVMVELALDISEELRNELFHFGGYTNGCSGYLPTAEEFDQGGYEVYWSMLIYYIYHGRVGPLRRESADELVKFVLIHYPG